MDSQFFYFPSFVILKVYIDYKEAKEISIKEDKKQYKKLTDRTKMMNDEL